MNPPDEYPLAPDEPLPAVERAFSPPATDSGKPSRDAGTDQFVDQFDQFTRTISIIDPGESGLTGTVDYGDGSGAAAAHSRGSASRLSGPPWHRSASGAAVPCSVAAPRMPGGAARARYVVVAARVRRPVRARRGSHLASVGP